MDHGLGGVNGPNIGLARFLDTYLVYRARHGFTILPGLPPHSVFEKYHPARTVIAVVEITTLPIKSIRQKNPTSFDRTSTTIQL
jgi:hypothetical protein